MPTQCKFTLYETKSRFYIIGFNKTQDCMRVLKIDRTTPYELNVTEDDVTYNKAEIRDLITMIENGNKASGGLHKVTQCHGIVGFVRFLEGYYIILITKRSAVALIGGHYIYHIDDTVLISIAGPATRVERRPEEARYVQIFNQLDLRNNFYFSYTYDITQTLQHNMSRPPGAPFQVNEMFVWNHYLSTLGFSSLSSEWCLPIIYGFVDQSRISVFGHSIYVTLIARRSRHFAGARFLKRGVNDKGYVANDVETEQIAHDANTTSFDHPRGKYGDKPAFTSFVQHRGSIPLFWSQEGNQYTPRPPIEITLVDPFYSAAAKHFNNMFERYGCPIIVLNLIKSKEKSPRESVLLDEFGRTIQYLNQFLKPEMKIRYIAWDMAKSSKSEKEDVIGILEDFAEEVLSTAGFFHSGPEPYMNALRRAQLLNTKEVNRILRRRQNGVVRTNCIDCLDRTNAAQFVIGKCALGHQLYALGVIAQPSIPFDSDALNMLNAMYHDHGDMIALQYGGSHLVNTMETYRKISHWTSHSRDMIESIRRYYNNSFADNEKQISINLFLGNFVPSDEQPFLWDLTSDYYLHNDPPFVQNPKQSYRNWMTADVSAWANFSISRPPADFDYFTEYYRPRVLTSLDRLFAGNMNPSLRLTGKDDPADLSPFTVRATASRSEFVIYNLNIGGVRRWLEVRKSPKVPSAKSRDDKGEDKPPPSQDPPEPWWTTSSLAARLLEPQVPMNEHKEYKRYVAQFKPSAIVMVYASDRHSPAAAAAAHMAAAHAASPAAAAGPSSSPLTVTGAASAAATLSPTLAPSAPPAAAAESSGRTGSPSSSAANAAIPAGGTAQTTSPPQAPTSPGAAPTSTTTATATSPTTSATQVAPSSPPPPPSSPPSAPTAAAAASTPVAPPAHPPTSSAHHHPSPSPAQPHPQTQPPAAPQQQPQQQAALPPPPPPPPATLHPDHAIFSDYVSTVGDRPLPLTVSAKDSGIYAHHCVNATKVATYLGSVVSRHEKNRYEVYKAYLNV